MCPLERRTAAGQCVLVQEGHAAEGPRARPALVLLHLGVRLQMSPQVRAVSECTVAVRAGERTLAGVCADVSPQQPWSGEGLPAGAADAGQCVRADVHLQRTQAVVLFGTVFAVEGGPGAGEGAGSSADAVLWAAVCELVAGQSSWAAAALPTVCALEAVTGVWTGRVRCAAVILLSTAAAAGRRAQVQGCGGAGHAGGDPREWQSTGAPHKHGGIFGHQGVIQGEALRDDCISPVSLTLQFTVVWLLVGEILLDKK